ncbi:hypothetical protein [Bacillus cereus]|uniref:Uncharacterized protein n=3 Tax=Bacillus TaxID=1386 RepID=A0A9W5K793_BACC8|nr:hypothetical protein [Bacillus cereus]EJR22354.1 hypothetical protein IIA_02389 [Bacillus cereus VD014]
MELNKLEKAMIVGIILRGLRNKRKIKQHAGLERLPDVIKLLDELQESTTLEDKEEAITSVINKLMDDLLENDKGRRKMYVTRIGDKEKLLKIIDALDELGKDYKVTKTTKHVSLPPVTYPKISWIVEELKVLKETQESK